MIIKTDAGPGCLSKEAASTEFLEEMTNLGVHILLLLPNGTECQAELNKMFSEFKQCCQKNTVQVAEMKMAARVAVCKKSTVDDIELVSSCGSDSDNDLSYGGELPEIWRSICNVSLTASDLSHVVNRYPGNPDDL